MKKRTEVGVKFDKQIRKAGDNEMVHVRSKQEILEFQELCIRDIVELLVFHINRSLGGKY